MSRKIYFGILALGVLAGIFFSSSTALAVANQIVRLDSTVNVSFSYPGGYDYTWYSDNPSIVQADGSGTSCRLTGKSVGTTTVHCQYKYNITYYDYILNRPYTDVYIEEEKFSVTVTNGEVQEGESGEVLNPADFQEMLDLSCGLIPVKKNNLWGFVDRDWRLIIPFQFDDIKYIFNERSQTACVKYNGEYYAIDRTGKMYGPLSDYWPYVVNNDFVELRYKSKGIVWQKSDGTTIDQSDIESIEHVGDAFDDADVLIPALSKNGQYGYLNRDYQWVIPPSFQMTYPFHGERAIALLDDCWRFIDRDGKIVSTLPEEQNFDQGIIQYTLNGGKTTVYFSWESFYLADGLCPATNYSEDGSVPPDFFYINEKGEQVLTQYLWGSSFVDGMAIVVNEEGYEGVINTKNEVLIPFEYKYHYSEQCLPGGGMSYLGEGVFAFHNDYGAPYFLLDSNGNRLTEETFDSVEPFSDGMARVSRNGQYGYINPQGKEIVPLVYRRLKFWESSRYAVAEKSDGSYQILEHPLIPCPHAYQECRDAVGPSCTTDGYSGDIYCTECKRVIKSGVKIPALGHTWGDWAADEANHWKACDCGEKSEYGPHTFTWIIDSAATTSAQGRKHQECSVCGFKQKEVPIDRLPDNSTPSKDDRLPDNSTPSKDDRLPDNSTPSKDDRLPEPSLPEKETSRFSLKKASVSGIQTLYYGKNPLVQKNLTVKVGNKTLKKGRDYDVSYRGNTKIGTASLTITGKGDYKDSLTKSFQIKVKRGSVHTVQGMRYQITNASTGKKGTVALIGTSKKKSDKRFTSLKIRDTVTIGGQKFRITAIGSRAFSGYTRLKTLTVGNQIKTIGAESFSGCVNLTKATFGSGVTTIEGKSFYGCKRLKNLTISSKKLTSVGKQAFQKNPKQAVLRVPAAKLKTYRKLWQKKTGFKGTVKKIK